VGTIPEMTKKNPIHSINTAAFVAVGYLFLLSTPANGFSFRKAHLQKSWLSSNTADLSICCEDTSAPGSDGSISSRRSMIRYVLPAAALFASTVVSNPSAANAGIDVSGLRVEGTPGTSSPPPISSSSNGIIELAGVKYTPAAMILQMAEQTASMEGMMKAFASDVQGQKSRQERVEAGSQGKGPGVVFRADLTRSEGIMVKNSQIATIAPRAAITLQGIPYYLSKKSPTTDMTFDEYLTIAKKYEEAREDLRIAFEKMSQEDQQEGK
jgi:hypothetical protein